jgi:hypothetical protein
MAKYKEQLYYYLDQKGKKVRCRIIPEPKTYTVHASEYGPESVRGKPTKTWSYTLPRGESDNILIVNVNDGYKSYIHKDRVFPCE